MKGEQYESYSLMDHETQKLLVVTGNVLAPKLAEYALNVAVRLDLEVLVLFVDESDVDELSNDERLENVARFKAKVEREATEFSALAWKSGVSVTTIVDVNQRETAIALTRDQDPEIRFILSDQPEDQEMGGVGLQRPHLKVIRPS